MLDSTTSKIYDAIERSPFGITTLDILTSLRLCDNFTLKTILSRLNKAKKIIRLKRGVYSVYPLIDGFVAAQASFNGYLGFSTALYLHKLTTEFPFTVFVVTVNTSKIKKIGQIEFMAVALKEKAVGLEYNGNYVISSRAKTLFDCIYIPYYAVEEEKLINVFQEAQLTNKEWKEFDYYVKKFVKEKNRKGFYEMKRRIKEG